MLNFQFPFFKAFTVRTNLGSTVWMLIEVARCCHIAHRTANKSNH